MYLLWLKSHISVLIEAVGGLGEYFVVEDRQECRLVPVDKRCFDLAMLKMFCDPNSCPNIWGNWVEFKVDSRIWQGACSSGRSQSTNSAMMCPDHVLQSIQPSLAYKRV